MDFNENKLIRKENNMSVLYPDLDFTTFPNALDNISLKSNITNTTDAQLVGQIQNAILAGDFSNAAAILNANPQLNGKIFNANDYEKSLPYNSCEIVYKEIIGTSCDSIQIMIALCYASLMSHFPGYTFYMLVKRIKDLKSIPKKMEDIFEIARNLMQEVNENQIKNLEERIDYALPIIENEVTVEKLYSPFMCDLKYCNNWLKSTYRHMIENEEKFRNTLIYIFLNLIDWYND